MAGLDALRAEGAKRAQRSPVSRTRIRKAAGASLAQMEEALSAGDSKRARELAGVLREMLQLYRELDSGESQSVTVCFVGETEAASV